MKNAISSLFMISFFISIAHAANPNLRMSGAVGGSVPPIDFGPISGTENSELVCDFDDFLGTKVFVDIDSTYDDPVEQLSSKVLEMPTKNAYAYNFKLFQVEVVKVIRSCETCDFAQTILYRADLVRDVINKLEVTDSHARLTRAVNEDGKPIPNSSFVFEGSCKSN